MNLQEVANDSRKRVLKMIYEAQTSHIGSNFSCAEIMAAVFDKIDLDKDKFILSAGWKAAMLYYHLWRKGRITEKELNSYCKDGSKFIGLSEPIHPDIAFAGGSMGMGLAAGVGFAQSMKMQGNKGRVFVLESDGGMNCGITWEAIMLASKLNLGNLTLIIDCNGFQAMGATNEIIALNEIENNLKEKMQSFGWYCYEMKGNDCDDIAWHVNPPPFTSPLCLIAHTTKGSGVSFMENDNVWHYRAPEKEEYELAMQELCRN